MVAALLVFLLVAGLVFAAYVVARDLPAAVAEHRVGQRLKEVGAAEEEEPATSVLAAPEVGMLPALDRAIRASAAASPLPRLIEQAGVKTAPGTVVLISVGLALALPLAATLFVRQPLALSGLGALGLAMPSLWLLRKRSVRVAKFEEQFPDALDLMARAIRAGHAFQTSMGMVADELAAPVGPEFRKTFDQQNFGLPLREALDGLAARVPLLDIRFFVTAVAIQRESGGNLSEILENLAHVVRERFKIRRQVRIHTAHGRFTGYVLLALPAALAAALSYVSPDQMQLLFREQMGQMMLAGAVVMQVIGFVWIRQVIRIEV
ncbi:MAG: type II secretion system F family protein [Vicinamibacterales bacterium]